jgi:hypothetical protein
MIYAEIAGYRFNVSEILKRSTASGKIPARVKDYLMRLNALAVQRCSSSVTERYVEGLGWIIDDDDDDDEYGA